MESRLIMSKLFLKLLIFVASTISPGRLFRESISCLINEFLLMSKFDSMILFLIVMTALLEYFNL